MFGFALAIISSIFFSLYVVPRKLSKLKPLQFSLLMSLGFFASAAVLYIFHPLFATHEKLSPVLLWSLLAGAIWATAFVTFVKAIDGVGLSRSNQWKNLQGPVAAILSLVVLSEYKTTNAGLVLMAGAAVFVAALLLTISDESQTKRANVQGAALAALSGLGFGAVAVIQKYVTTNSGVYTQQAVWSFAIMASLLMFTLLTRRQLPKISLKDRDSKLALSAGLLYLGASLFQLLSYNRLPASIAFTVIQLNAVWTIAIGVIYFREISLRKHYIRIFAGLFFAVTSIILLAIARG